jgi:flagellar FliJ protein
MKKSKRFEPIQEIVSSSAQELSRAMAEAGQRVAELERQFLQLKSYREDYTNGAAQGGGAMDAVKLTNYRTFLDRLAQALRQHELKLNHARAEYDVRRQQWSQKRIEAETLGKAIDRFRKQEAHIADQREQREGDDTALRLSIARAEAGNS